MKHFTLLLCLVAVLSPFNTYAQSIGINSTGAAPDTSAILDVSSTSKGFLMPRMTSSQISAIGAPAKGMGVYNSSINSFQTNIGTSGTPSWGTVSTRTNYVVVHSASDFPAASGGIITLAANTLYEINGTVTVPDKIDLNGCMLKGADLLNDKLVYSGSSELFTGSNGGFLQNLIVSAPVSGSKLFNLNAAGATKNFVMQTCYVMSCDNVGIIRGFGGKVVLGATSFLNNNNGITFQDCEKLSLQMNMFDNTNKNTFITLTGTFSEIQIADGYRITSSANSAVALDITGLTALTKGSLKDCLFSGTGTLVNGTFSSAWEVNADGLTTQTDDQAYGSFYVSTNTATAIATVNTAMKVAGTTTSSNLFRFTMPSSNRLTYTGTKTRVFNVTASITTLAEADNKYFTVYIAKNGSTLPESKQKFKQTKSAEEQSQSVSCLVSLATNDYVEVWIENNTDNKDFTAEYMNVSIN